MRRTALLALAPALLGTLAIACGGDSQPQLTTLSLTKTVVETGEGEFRFSLELTNEGDNVAVNVTTSDVWQEGLAVTEIGAVEGQQPQAISDFGLQFTLKEIPAGRTVQLHYTAQCRQRGNWQNTAAASAINSEPAQAVATVACP